MWIIPKLDEISSYPDKIRVDHIDELPFHILRVFKLVLPYYLEIFSYFFRYHCRTSNMSLLDQMEALIREEDAVSLPENVRRPPLSERFHACVPIVSDDFVPGTSDEDTSLNAMFQAHFHSLGLRVAADGTTDTRPPVNTDARFGGSTSSSSSASSSSTMSPPMSSSTSSSTSSSSSSSMGVFSDDQPHEMVPDPVPIHARDSSSISSDGHDINKSKAIPRSWCKCRDNCPDKSFPLPLDLMAYHKLFASAPLEERRLAVSLLCVTQDPHSHSPYTIGGVEVCRDFFSHFISYTPRGLSDARHGPPPRKATASSVSTTTTEVTHASSQGGDETKSQVKTKANAKTKGKGKKKGKDNVIDDEECTEKEQSEHESEVESSSEDENEDETADVDIDPRPKRRRAITAAKRGGKASVNTVDAGAEVKGRARGRGRGRGRGKR